MITVGSIVSCKGDSTVSRIGKIIWMQSGSGERRLACIQCRNIPFCVPVQDCELVFLNCFGTFYDKSGNLITREEVEAFCDESV